MDWINVAKQLLSDISNSRTPDQHIALAQAQATIALVEEQRKTNELLALALQTAVSINRYGDTSSVEKALDNFAQHLRPDWPGHCGTDETPE
jgi:hypothetical protein